VNEDEYDEVVFKKFCGGGGGGGNEKLFDVGDIVQVVGRLALEDNLKYVCINIVDLVF